MDSTRNFLSISNSLSPVRRGGIIKYQSKLTDWYCEKSVQISGISFPVSLLSIEGKLFVGSCDDTIRTWNEQHQGFTKTFRGGAFSLLCLITWNVHIAAGTHDGNIALWSHGGELKQVLKGHTKRVQCLCTWKTKLVSGSYDKTVRIWNENGTLFRILEGHENWVTSLLVHPKTLRLYTGSADCTIRIWNVEEGICENMLEGHLFWVRCLCWFNEQLASGSADCTIRVWKALALPGEDKNEAEFDATTTEEILEGHTSGVECVLPWNQKLISGSYDMTIRIWNELFECERVLNGHQSFVTCLTLWRGKLVSGSEDKTLKFWATPADQPPNGTDPSPPSLLQLSGTDSEARVLR
eukprot:TRINITY_DN5306_c0_g1_i1.p1 TRINITY_DN5306_c0_g1~~TRINITY_DN5306_c0_g1_i1.p1  ORF type:complete len:353 (+),score=51.39 TRINITY_DN5306_c0_g1_i1:1-1059(+)